MPGDPKLPYAFDERTAMRLARMLQWWESQPKNTYRPAETTNNRQRAFYLAQNSGYVLAGNTDANFTIYSGTAGSETASNYTGVSAFIREGIVFANRTYKLMEINGVLEVINPDLQFYGKPNADIASAAVGTVSIYYRSDTSTMTDTTVDTPSSVVYNATDTTATSAKGCHCVWQPYTHSGTYIYGWMIVGHDC